MSAPLLSIRGLVAAYGNIEALKGVDLDIHPGEIVALIGSNGAGKSTLMMSVFGRPRARAGLIAFDGRDITHEPTHHVARLRIAQSPEGRRIFPRMTVAENLRMGADAAMESTEAERSENLERVFTLFPRLKERIAQRGGTLSGGEQQMLAIGRALMSRPRLLMRPAVPPRAAARRAGSRSTAWAYPKLPRCAAHSGRCHHARRRRRRLSAARGRVDRRRRGCEGARLPPHRRSCP